MMWACSVPDDADLDHLVKIVPDVASGSLFPPLPCSERPLLALCSTVLQAHLPLLRPAAQRLPALESAASRRSPASSLRGRMLLVTEICVLGVRGATKPGGRVCRAHTHCVSARAGAGTVWKDLSMGTGVLRAASTCFQAAPAPLRSHPAWPPPSRSRSGPAASSGSCLCPQAGLLPCSQGLCAPVGAPSLGIQLTPYQRSQWTTVDAAPGTQWVCGVSGWAESSQVAVPACVGSAWPPRTTLVVLQGHPPEIRGERPPRPHPDLVSRSRRLRFQTDLSR
ncbi:uncharacterized protein LOC112480545 isoform X2 [Pteropus alecto]|uniref:uncharacterized protein LOC112480545 isoform X2 n=1 Tax=Pteropus alecto TaxID=9402 RepID=UPI000D53A8F5|nr:uncharacterized protein LOC112480545 isoform X2 [Pteropus alecto]